MKSALKWSVMLTVAVFGLVSCGNIQGSNLYYGSHQKWGLTFSVGTAEDNGLGLGYNIKDIAVIPVVPGDKDQNPVMTGEGSNAKLAEINSSASNGDTDAFSVIGKFNASTKSCGLGIETRLGKFFATGVAAQEFASALLIADDKNGCEEE